MSEQEVRPGQYWGLWILDHSYYEYLTIESLSEDGRTAYGRADNGDRCFVGVRRLHDFGELLRQA